MRTLRSFTNISLDGYFTDASGDMSWAHKRDDEWNAFSSGNARGDAALLFGRITYEIMKAFWSTPQAAQMLPDVPSRNLIGELVGREKPDEVVVFGGHIDSWDVGTGAMDDAGGVVIAWEAVRLLQKLGLGPHDLVAASREQLTHKMVSRACPSIGSRLAPWQWCASSVRSRPWARLGWRCHWGSRSWERR